MRVSVQPPLAWADFFIDMSLCEGRSFTLSRMLVMYVFPVFMVPAVFVGAVFPFRRDKGGGHEELNNSIDKHWSRFEQYFPGFLCYPEGTRNIKPHSLPLKRGMLRYAHSGNFPFKLSFAREKRKCCRKNVSPRSETTFTSSVFVRNP